MESEDLWKAEPKEKEEKGSESRSFGFDGFGDAEQKKNRDDRNQGFTFDDFGSDSKKTGLLPKQNKSAEENKEASKEAVEEAVDQIITSLETFNTNRTAIVRKVQADDKYAADQTIILLITYTSGVIQDL